jgi:hypothetical protein
VLEMPAPVAAGLPVVVIPVVAEVTPSSVPTGPSCSGPSPLHPSRTPKRRQEPVVVCGSLHAERGIELGRGRFIVKPG